MRRRCSWFDSTPVRDILVEHVFSFIFCLLKEVEMNSKLLSDLFTMVVSIATTAIGVGVGVIVQKKIEDELVKQEYNKREAKRNPIGF